MRFLLNETIPALRTTTLLGRLHKHDGTPQPGAVIQVEIRDGEELVENSNVQLHDDGNGEYSKELPVLYLNIGQTYQAWCKVTVDSVIVIDGETQDIIAV